VDESGSGDIERLALRKRIITGCTGGYAAGSFTLLLVLACWPPAWINRPLSVDTPVTPLFIGTLLLILSYFLVVTAYAAAMTRYVDPLEKRINDGSTQ
jgi:hypothetical protein